MMIAENGMGSVRVKFSFPNELNSKPFEIVVNPYYPLFNYKRQIETNSKIDLYGKKLNFEYTHNSSNYKIEYVQDIAKKTGGTLKNELELQVKFEEVGG